MCQWSNHRWLHHKLLEAAEYRAQILEKEKEFLALLAEQFPTERRWEREIHRVNGYQTLIGQTIIGLHVSDSGTVTFDSESAFFSDAARRFESALLTLIPTVPTSCQGCRNYHGRDGIVCAIHPHGVTPDETCADWEIKRHSS